MIRDWYKSSYCSQPDGACVEVRLDGGATEPGEQVGVRDTKNRAGEQLGFSGEAWNNFLLFTTH